MGSDAESSRRKHRRSSSDDDNSLKRHKHRHHRRHHRHRHSRKNHEEGRNSEAEDMIPSAPLPPPPPSRFEPDDDLEEGEILEEDGLRVDEDDTPNKKTNSDANVKVVEAGGIFSQSDDPNLGLCAGDGLSLAEARTSEKERIGINPSKLRTLGEEKSVKDLFYISTLDKEDKICHGSTVVGESHAESRNEGVEFQEKFDSGGCPGGHINGYLGQESPKCDKRLHNKSSPPRNGSLKKVYSNDEYVEGDRIKLRNIKQSLPESTYDKYEGLVHSSSHDGFLDADRSISRSMSDSHSRERSNSRGGVEEEARSKRSYHHNLDVSLYIDGSKFEHDLVDEKMALGCRFQRHGSRDLAMDDEMNYRSKHSRYNGVDYSSRSRDMSGIVRSKEKETNKERRKENEQERSRGREMDGYDIVEKERERSRGREREGYNNGEKHRERSRDRGREKYYSGDKKRERSRDTRTLERDKSRERDVDKDSRRDKERGKSKEKEVDSDRKREKERVLSMENVSSRDRDRERVIEKQRDRNSIRVREREWERERDWDRKRRDDRSRDKNRNLRSDKKVDDHEDSYGIRDHKHSRHFRYDESDYKQDKTKNADSEKIRSSKTDALQSDSDKQKMDQDREEDYEEKYELQISDKEEEDLNRIKEESRRRRQAILEKYRSQDSKQQVEPHLEEMGKDKEPVENPGQPLPEIIDGVDEFVADPSFAVEKLLPQNPITTSQTNFSHGGLGEGTPKSERSGEMFCDDIFGETPTAVRKMGKGDGLQVDRGGLTDNWDDADGYYSYRFGEVMDGRYEVTAAHGKGVFSTVIRAKNLKTGNGEPEEVAIKILRNNETMYKAGLEELVILKKLVGADPDDRRHCVRFLSSFKYRNHLCLVFESLHMNLREVLKKFGRNIGLKLTAVRAYAKQLFIALKHLKNCGVLHCDIKPDNMLVNEGKNVLKLCDFGNAMFAGKNEITPYLVSRFYRAPEIILGLPYDHHLDIWSVGCCLYELYTGKVLFPGQTNNDMLRLHMELKGPFPKKMLRKGAFTDQHFDQDLNFHATEEDPVTKKTIKRIIVNIKLKDIGSIIMGYPGEDPKMLANFKDLLDKIFVLDPDKRMTVSQALNHPFITGK